MECTHYFDIRFCPGSLEKRLTRLLLLKVFFRPGTSTASGLCASQSTTPASWLELSKPAHQDPPLVGVPFFSVLHSRHGRSSCVEPSKPHRLDTGLIFYLRHLLKEYIVTLTNNIRIIEASAQLALQHCDEKDYPHAHLDLDVIVAKVRIIRTHIDHLQNVLDFAPVCKGEDPS